MSDATYAEVVRDWSARHRAQFPLDRFTHFMETGSTNDDLLKRVREGKAEPFELIVADFQTRGRGRRGDRWEAVPGDNLLFSIALPLPENPQDWGLIPLITGYLVGRELEAILPNDSIQIKWPNDLLCRGRKLGGILVETVVQPTPVAVVGVGLNLNMREEAFPDALQNLAISLYEVLGCESSRWYLLGQIIRGFLDRYPSIITKPEEAVAWIGSRDSLVGKEITFREHDQTRSGRCRGIGADGSLLVETAGGKVESIISAHQISFSPEED